MMNDEELDFWWGKLTIYTKEYIAQFFKGDSKYPSCTCWWKSIHISKKNEIYDICTDEKGRLLSDWKDGKVQECNGYGKRYTRTLV